MGKTIQVTSAQVNAARLWIERANRDGIAVPDAIRKLAEARPRPIITGEPMPPAPSDTVGAAALADAPTTGRAGRAGAAGGAASGVVRDPPDQGHPAGAAGSTAPG